MTRVATLDTFNRALQRITDANARVARAQEQIATGTRITTPADDPYGAAQVLLFEQNLAALNQFTRNADSAEVRLQREEVSLTSAGDLLQRARELLIQANNANQSDETRRFVAVELREIRDQLVDIANSQDGRGRFLFAGNRDTDAPFVLNGGVVTYGGDQGTRNIQIGEGLFIEAGDDGASVFMRVPRGNGTFVAQPAIGNTGNGIVARQSVVTPGVYTGEPLRIVFSATDAYDVIDSGGATIATGAFSPGDTVIVQGLGVEINGEPQGGDEFEVATAGFQSVFAAIENVASALDAGAATAASRAALSSTLNRGLDDLDQALGVVLETRATVGTRLRSIDTQRDLNAGYALITQDVLGDIRDLDYTQAISELSQQLTALEAAQASFVRIQGLSLFNVL
ncbi:MAG: flagellar hook-associated protein FlgL [Pseudomonadota bacterium]